MTETILRLLTRLSEAGDDAILPGALARPFYGPAFDRLLAKRVLVEQAPLADWDVCDSCECGSPCRPIRKARDGYRADCPLDPCRDVVLSENDLRVFRIDGAALASALAMAAGLSGPVRSVADGVWKIGETPSGRGVFLALEASALAADGIASTLRKAAKRQEITVLAPSLPADVENRLNDAGFHLVETLEALVPASGGFGAAFDVSALTPVSETPTLHVRTAVAEVRWGHRSVILSHQLFPVFQRLLEKALSRDPVASGPHIEGTTGREAKDLIRELRDAFKAVGFTDGETKALITTVRGRGYKLDVPASDIVVDG